MIMSCIDTDIPWASFILRHKQAVAVKCDPVGTTNLLSEESGEGGRLQEKICVYIYVFKKHFYHTSPSFSTFWFCKQRNVWLNSYKLAQGNWTEKVLMLLYYQSHLRWPQSCLSLVHQRKGKDIKEEGESYSVQFSSVAQLCPTLCRPMDCSTPGLPVQHQLLEFIQTHVHWVSDVIQPSHPLSSPSPPVFNLSQYQGLFKRVTSSHQVAKVWELQFQHQSFQWIFRTDFL